MVAISASEYSRPRGRVIWLGAVLALISGLTCGLSALALNQPLLTAGVIGGVVFAAVFIIGLIEEDIRSERIRKSEARKKAIREYSTNPELVAKVTAICSGDSRKRSTSRARRSYSSSDDDDDDAGGCSDSCGGDD